MRKKLIVLQNDCKDCGSACLLSIVRYYGGNVSLNSLIEMTNTDKKGTNFYNLMITSKRLGLDAVGYYTEDLKQLKEMKMPLICQFLYNNYTHFVVVYKYSSDRITIMDPARGKVVMKEIEFLSYYTGYLMTFLPAKPLPFIKDNKYLKKIIFQVLVRNKKLILIVLLLSIIYGMSVGVYSYFFQIVIEYVIDLKALSLASVIVIFLVVVMTKIGSNFFRNEALIYLEEKIDMTMVIDTFDKILLLPYSYYKNRTTGEVVSRLNDLIWIKSLVSKIIGGLAIDLIILLGVSIVLFTISSKLSVIILVIAIVYIIILYGFKSITKKYISLNQDNSAKVNSFLYENIYGYETVKGLNLESSIIKKFSKLYSRVAGDLVFLERISNREMLVKDLVYGLGILMVYYMGFLEVLNYNLALTEFITFNSLIIYFLESLRNMVDISKDYYYATSSIRRVESLFEVKGEKLIDNKLEVRGNIEIVNLSYSYNQKTMVLNKINLRIKEREKVLILGSSGSGKSTLLKLLYGYYRVERGRLFINGYDINDLELGTLRKNISYISQNEYLFNETIKNNIILDRKVEEEKFLKICKLTFVEEVVRDKFLGYDLMVEENGVNISGGQRQRIILARTLLKNSEIMLIDEGLSEVDVNLERRILRNIFDEYTDKTIVIVSHKLDNLDLYDKVIKMQDSEIIDVLERNSGDG